METLPKDVAIEMALNLSPPDLISFCSSSKTQNRICNSNDFWRRKLEKDYPEELFEFYKSGTPVENPKQVYINKFTFLSRKIEEFVEEFIEKIFQDNFSKFLSKEYKKELYSNLYKIYEEIKIEKLDDDEEMDSVIMKYLSTYVPRSLIIDDAQEGSVTAVVRPFLNYLLLVDSSNKIKQKLGEEWKQFNS